jgi:hypothetical protein
MTYIMRYRPHSQYALCRMKRTQEGRSRGMDGLTSTLESAKPQTSLSDTENRPTVEEQTCIKRGKPVKPERDQEEQKTK